MLAAAGVEAIGLNFFEGSKRFVDTDSAVEIVEQLDGDVKRVGVFVNASVEAVLMITEKASLDYVQLHGDESPAFLDQLVATAAEVKVIKAFRCKNGLNDVGEFLTKCSTLPAAVLVDAYDPVEYGGTGKSLYWPDLKNSQEVIGGLPLILAGGLTPQNVAQAIQEARPYGVDTASGVETQDPRRKDQALSTQFVSAANAAFPKP